MNPSRFNTETLAQLETVATPEQIDALRQAMRDAGQGHLLWKWSLLARLLELVRASIPPGRAGDGRYCGPCYDDTPGSE